MISSDPLFQGFTFISWLIFVHPKQTSKQKIAKQNKNTYNEKKSSGTLNISPLRRNFRHRELAFKEAENMAYLRRPVCKQTTKNTAANQYPLILTRFVDNIALSSRRFIVHNFFFQQARELRDRHLFLIYPPSKRKWGGFIVTCHDARQTMTVHSTL